MTDTAKVDLEDFKLKSSSLIEKLAKREYPNVYVVVEDSQEDRFVWEMQQQNMPGAQRRHIAEENGIAVLNALDVLKHLQGEMDPDAKQFLREEVARIFAAKQGKVILNDDGQERAEVAGEWGYALLAAKAVSVEDLSEEDVDRCDVLGPLEARTKDLAVPFTINPTARVLAFVRTSE